MSGEIIQTYKADMPISGEHIRVYNFTDIESANIYIYCIACSQSYLFNRTLPLFSTVCAVDVRSLLML